MGAGMGTSGLVGQFGTITAMAGKVPSLKLYLSILLLHFILPAVLSLLIALPMRKWGWIKDGDMKLNI